MDIKLLCGIGLGTASLAGNATIAKKPVIALPQKPNVVFIVADDLGYGDLSCYGMTRAHTPNVDALAHNGLRFTDAHAVAATSTPSRYSLFTGQYSWRRNDTHIAPGNAGMIIRPEQITIADMFKKAGYVTGAIGKWHLGLGDKTGTQDWNAEFHVCRWTINEWPTMMPRHPSLWTMNDRSRENHWEKTILKC